MWLLGITWGMITAHLKFFNGFLDITRREKNSVPAPTLQNPPAVASGDQG